MPVVVIQEKIAVLPFYESMSWKKFETLCADVLYKTFNSVDSRDYLKKSNGQQGLDVYSIRRDEEK